MVKKYHSASERSFLVNSARTGAGATGANGTPLVFSGINLSATNDSYICGLVLFVPSLSLIHI